ncbi:hypothetical protein bcgnr5378_04980 [Bacillus cereus]|uniref:Uncharacterized protein n=1 Tax=Bacillus cereus TaxID=1396 RepID=A0A164LE68_BACCE|nr:hypothetical protein [Bacillus cereus]KZD55720.1 hypothetical protein B4088_5465 [Bacillus cereus]
MNPFASRMMKRFFMVAGGFVGGFIIAAILNVEIFLMLPMLAMFGLPIYFVMQDNKGKNSCIEIIRNKYNQNSILTVEVYHDSDLEWGFLTLTEEALYFVPKKGEIFKIPHSYYTDYGYRGLSTGNYATTASRIGNTNMSVGSTREIKAPIFYVVPANGDEVYWHTRNNEKMFKAVQKLNGKDRSNLKSNY